MDIQTSIILQTCPTSLYFFVMFSVIRYIRYDKRV